MFKAWVLVLPLIVAAVVGCGESGSEPGPELPPPVIVSVTEMIVTPEHATPPPGVTQQDAQPEQVDRPAGAEGVFPNIGIVTKEELILMSEAVARVSLLDTTTSTATTTLDGSTVWRPVLKFSFRVQEYLKGSGANTVTAVVHDFGFYDTEAEAEEQIAWMLSAHDTRWDHRQAIVFLDSDTLNYPDLPSGWYVLGGIIQSWDNTYSIESDRSKTWLPQSTASTRSVSDPTFLLDDPASGSGTGARSGSAPTISLSAMKKLVSGLEAEVRTAGNTVADRACVLSAYRVAEYFRRRGDDAIVWSDHTIRSGLPAGTLIASKRTGTGTPPENIGRQWFEGPDRDLVRFEASDFEPYTVYGPPISGPNERVRYTNRFLTARPLPAGSYSFFNNILWPPALVCDAHANVGRNIDRHRLTVTAPPSIRVRHEAFFDPVAIGGAVGADGTNGVLKPASFTLDGATITISSLKWENNAVTLGASPTSTLAGHALDFIDVTGTTTLSLTSDNASTTPLTWTVPDKPWADGDLLMLRIREPVPPSPVTVTLTPRPEGSFTFFDVTVSWNDPQTCDGQYFVYIGTGSSLIRNMGFHAPTVSSASASTGWLYNDVPDFWAVVRCDPSDYGASREVGRSSLRAAVE